MKTLVGTTVLHGLPCAVFRVSLADGRQAFMRVDRSNYNNDERAVVEVDASRFLRLWQAPGSSHRDVAMGIIDWHRDRKMHWAEDAFADGKTNPVPLANASCETYSPQRGRSWLSAARDVFFRRRDITPWPTVTFGDGVTRTAWLIGNGAKIFPVEVSRLGAPLLQERAGLPGNPFQSVDALVPQHTYNTWIAHG